MLNRKQSVILFILILLLGQVAFGTPVAGIQFDVTGDETFTEDNNVYTFTVTKSGALVAGTVTCTLQGIAIYGEDYNNIGGTAGMTTTEAVVSFAAGELSKTITIQCIDDIIDEPDQNIVLKLSNATAETGSKSIGTNKAIKTIQDNDIPPTASIAAAGSPLAEDGGTGTVTITLSMASQRLISVELGFEGSATGGGVDYTNSGTTLDFDRGETVKTMTVTAVNDAVNDDNETIVVKCVKGTRVTIPATTVSFHIEQEDPPTVTRIPNLDLLEDQTSAKIPFQIGDDEDPVSALRVFGRAENKTLVPDENFKLYGSGTDWEFRVVPAANQTGSTKGWIMVYDGIHWTSTHFIITVTPVNDAPVFDAPLPVTEMEPGETCKLSWGLLDFTTDVDNADSTLMFCVKSSVHITATLNADTLELTAESGWEGADSVQVFVSDGALTDSAYCNVIIITGSDTEPVASEPVSETADALMQATGIDQAGEIPEAFALHANYPNPFNPVTSISYALPEPAFVTISVYNAVGQCIATLVNGNKAAGIHTASWDAGRHSSGIYFYQIQANDFHAMHRCVLLK